MNVYIAGPLFTSGELETNIVKAMDIAVELIRVGHTPILTHPMGMWSKSYGESEETWIDYCYRLIDSCDAVLRIPGESIGSDLETVYANVKNKPVYHDYRQIPAIRV